MGNPPLGKQFVGFVKDKAGSKIATLLEIVLCAGGFACLIFYNENDKYNYFAFLMCFTWGFQDAGINCMVNSLLGFEFDSKITPFAVFKFV